MLPVRGLFEAHITVQDFDRAVAFYRDLLGFELGILQAERPAAFFWIGGRGIRRPAHRATGCALDFGDSDQSLRST